MSQTIEKEDNILKCQTFRRWILREAWIKEILEFQQDQIYHPIRESIAKVLQQCHESGTGNPGAQFKTTLPKALHVCKNNFMALLFKREIIR